MKRVVIIGAGLGGLSTALRLNQAGFEVLVFEKQSRPGGRSNLIHNGGFRVDTGPTILVMKETFEELYQSIGEDINQRIGFTQLEPNYRIYFHDQSSLDLSNNMAKIAQELAKIDPRSVEWFFRFLGESARKYELGMDFVTRNYQSILGLANPQAGLRLLKTQAYQNLYHQVSKYFHGNDKLTKAFSFHSMFLGLSPFEALAMYSLITYADIALGMWYPKGGIYRLVEDLVDLANQRGIQIQTSAAVEEIGVVNGKVRFVRLESGEEIAADFVVSNADLPYTYRSLISPKFRRDYPDRCLDRMKYACSGYLLYLGVDRTYSHLCHQSLFFSKDYRANLDAIFKSKTLPEDPSFHLNIPTITDPTLAPQGYSLIYVLAPMPNLEAQIDWASAAPIIRLKLLHRLEQIVDPEIVRHIVWEREYRPTDWLKDFNATLGTAFGSLSHGFFQSSYFRPHNKAYDIEGLYFVGQGTYPGIGMPMVVISSRLVTERILKECS